MSEYYQFRNETGTPIDYYELVNDNNELCKENEQLKSQLQQKENIIKEAREKVHDIYFRIDNIPQNHWIGFKLDTTNQGQELLEILDKGEIK